MDKLAPKLIRRAAKKGYIAIVIDPIYKVITGDENSADQMAKFCNQFDLVCSELGCAVIYCHHHSKGSQGQKRSMDRASGSGVFARDPDAMLDMIELDVTEELRKAEGDRAALDVALSWLHRRAADADDLLSQDDACSLPQTLKACEKVMSAPLYKALTEAVDEARQAATKRTAWRIEGTLREFAPFPPRNLWFDYPVHHLDKVGSLGDIEPEEERPAWQKATAKRKKNANKERDAKREKFETAFQSCNFGNPPTVAQLSEALEASPRTIRNWVQMYGYTIDKNQGNVVTRGNDHEK
jgi:RecA-family ATPase